MSFEYRYVIMRVIQWGCLGLLLLGINCSPTQKLDITENEMWTMMASNEIDANDGLPTTYQLLKLDGEVLERKLNESETPVISIPTYTANFITVKLEDAGTMSPVLAAKFSNIKSYRGEAIADSRTTIRLDKNASGLYAMVTKGEEIYFINPVEKGSDKYVVYEKQYAKRGSNPFVDQVIK